jgi:dTDP-glucose 4,6-dehydratase
MSKIVYVTGGLGFIGYHVARMCLYAGFYVIGVDKKTYAANLNLLPNLQKFGKQFKFIESDINDLDSLHDCDYVINTAAETHVDNSIVNSDVFVRSNINGVHHLLKLIREHYKMPTLLHFSTDEVYGDIAVGSHTEQDLLKPSNPYSATKAAADMLVLAWARTYGVPYIIVRPTNNYGIGQYVEKLIPKMCKYLSLGRKIPLHQGGTPRRTWLHALDTANAIITLIEHGVTNEIYNISGNYEEQNIEVVKKILQCYFIHDKYNVEDHLDLTFARPGQDVRYSIDDTKLRNLGWKPQADFDKELPDIVSYYKENFIW